VRDVTREVLLYDMPWAVPLLAVSLIRMGDAALRRSLTILAAVFGATLLLPLAGNVPFPRNYLPLLLPVVVLSSVGFADLALGIRVSRPRRAAALVALALIAVVAGRELTLHAFRDVRVSGAQGRPTSLIDQYQHLPDFNKSAMVTMLKRTDEASVLVVPIDVYWDFADTLDHQRPAVGSVLLCMVQNETLRCRFTREHRVPVRRVFVVDWNPVRHERLVQIFLDAHGVAERPALRPVTMSFQYKMWVADVAIALTDGESDIIGHAPLVALARNHP
jgi:hypothetical protein